MDYTEIGLNEYLQPLNAPVSQDRGYVSNLEFDRTTDLPLGRINYSNLTASSRTYTAIVSLSRETGTFDKIQEAINYVNNQGGGIIFIRNGTYVFSSDITLYSNITLLGESKENTIIDFNGTTNHITISDASSIVNVSILNITVQNSESTTCGIYIQNGSNIKIRDNIFTHNITDDNLGGDIYIDSSNQVDIAFNKTKGGGAQSGSLVIISGASTFLVSIHDNYGAFFKDSAIKTSGTIPYTVVYNNQFDSLNKSAINGVFTDMRVYNNKFTNTAGLSGTIYMLDYGSGSGKISVSNNNITCTANVGGVSLGTANGGAVQIVGNSITNNTREGVLISNTTKVTLASNFIETTGTLGADGVKCVTVEQSSITGNVIRVGASAGHGINGDNFDTTGISGNHIVAFGPSRDGIRFSNGCNDNAISGNYIASGTSGTCYAVNISDANSNNNAVVGNALNGLTGGINDAGSGNVGTSNS